MKRNALIFLAIAFFILLFLPIQSAAENDKIIIVKIKKKTLELIENGKIIKKYRIRVGKKSTPTPIGEGYIFEKRNPAIFKYQDPPNKGKVVRYSILGNGRIVKIDYKKIRALGFRINGYKTDKYSIHSITDPSTIGKAISGGCVGLTIKDMLGLYPLIEKNTKIIINP